MSSLIKRYDLHFQTSVSSLWLLGHAMVASYSITMKVLITSVMSLTMEVAMETKIGKICISVRCQ